MVRQVIFWPTFGTPENGKVKFTAGPNAAIADAKTFFVKVKLAP